MTDRSPPEPVGTSRALRKEQTRRRLLAAAHTLLAEQGFTSLSLREVTKEAGVVPAAFYRHFDDLDALGLALVEESFRSLNETVRAARDHGDAGLSTATSGELLRLLRYSRENGDRFRFIVRERFGGSSPVRAAIAKELLAWETDFALDLARLPALHDWPPADVRLLASLLGTVMTRAVEETVEARDAAEQEEIEHRVLRQLQLIGVGIVGWHGVAGPAGL